MTALEILRAQHRDVLSLFKRIASGNGDRRKAVEELAAKLRLHARLEEAIFYPALQAAGAKRVQEEILESYEEHHLVEYLLTQLENAGDEDSEPYLARMRVLQSLVEEHIEEEEAEVFKHAENLSDDAVRELDRRMEDEVEEVERVDELLGRAARVARRTEQWAGSLLDAGFGMPRRAVSALAPSRWIRADHHYVLAARIASAVPRIVVDSVYNTVTRREGAQRRSA